MTTTSTIKRNNIYLKNKDLLREIHKSKSNFCEFDDEKYQNFDVIYDDINICLTPEGKQTAKKNKFDKLKKDGEQIYDSIDDIKDEDLVFRVYTYEHIPLDSTRKKKIKRESDKHTKVNFIPFKHYIIQNNKLVEVGRSHSKNGEFSMDAQITDTLAQMYMLMIERYSERYNWRGYCVDENTEALTKRGWLKYNEITENDTILSYENGDMKWSKIESIFRDDYDGLMFKMDSKGIDALVTPGHKIVTKDGLKRIDYMLESDQIVILGDELKTDFEPIYPNELVELVGWVITEGNIQPKKGVVTIYQNEGKYADRIRSCLDKLNLQFTERMDDRNNIAFRLWKKDSEELIDLLPNKNLTMDFITKLTTDQRNLLIETMIDGDGWRRGKNKQYNSYTQKDKEHVDLYQALCAISGQKTNSHKIIKESFGKEVEYHEIHTFSNKSTRGECINLHEGKSGRQQIGKGKFLHPNKPTFQYKGKVWCPKTEFGCFVARRNGKVYLTGNTYVDEMKGQALLQLIQVGLQFNEMKSKNPFSYYTACLYNSFLKMLEIEKRNQNIRDDLLIKAGQNPSFTRQLEYDEHIRKMRDNINDDEDMV